MHKCGYCRHVVSVCLSVTFVSCAKTNQDTFEFFSPSDSQAILVFPYQTEWRYSDGNPPNGGVECRWGIGRNRDTGLIAGYRRLLDVRSVKNSYRRPSHSRRHSECLLVTACSMDEYAEERRTEKNLIVRSGRPISEAETTNNKRLRSTFCIEAITDTKHRAASLRQQSFLFCFLFVYLVYDFYINNSASWDANMNYSYAICAVSNDLE